MLLTEYDEEACIKVWQEDGYEKGHSEGILEGKIEAARNAIELGIEPLKNSSITGLPLEEIQKLQAELSAHA